MREVLLRFSDPFVYSFLQFFLTVDALVKFNFKMPSEAKKKQQLKKKEAAKARQQSSVKPTTTSTSAVKSKPSDQKKLNQTGDGTENGVNGTQDAELLAEGKRF